MIGRTLAHYQITAAIGAGGMGEVYRATDTRLGREVALKLLPKAFASDPERLARFEREARLLASLNHSGIAHLYGFETATLEGDGVVHLLAMELVEGEDLAERLKRGPVPVDEAIAIARQIAEALEEAHEKGIVHRDLKPANVKLTPDGKVKVLDFGLAKAWTGDGAGAGSSADLSHSPTLAHTGASAGLILGTAAYMSPEQARGKPVDKRTDIWAFGVVLFEMLSGRRLFAGETVSDTLAAVLRQDVEWAALPDGTPVSLRRLLRRCLERDPRQRLRDMADAGLEIAEAMRPGASAEAAKAQPPSRWVAGAAVAALLGWAATAVVLWPKPRPAAPVVRFEIPAVAKTELNLADRPVLDVTADGGRMVFVAREEGVSRLYLRDRSDVEPRPIRGTEGASNPVFSPSGTSIAFFAGSALKLVSLDGAVSTVGAATADSRGLTWAGSDRIIFAPDAVGPLSAVSRVGGATSAVSKLEEARGERTHRWPQALPGAEAVLFTVGTFSNPDSYDDSRIEAVVLTTGERRVLLTGARMARYVPASGHLLFARGSTVHAVRFDPRTLTTQGEPVALLRDVDGDSTTGASHFACAEDGTFVYVPGSSQASLRKLAWVSRDGTAEDVAVPPALYNDVRIAPDGQRFAVAMGTSGLADIWIYEPARKSFTRLTFDGQSATPEWSADSRTVYFATLDASGVRTTFQRKAADGSREAEGVGRVDGRAYLGGLEEGARSAIIGLYGDAATRTKPGIYRFPLDAASRSQKASPIVDTPGIEFAPRLSPDRRWLAFHSSTTGAYEVYVRDLAGTGAQWQVTSTGGEEPNWSPDGRELFYRADRRLMVVPVETRGRFAAGPATLLLDGIYNLRSETGISFDVSPRGDQFLMIRPADEGARTARLRVVLNVFAELARAMKADR